MKGGGAFVAIVIGVLLLWLVISGRAKNLGPALTTLWNGSTGNAGTTGTTATTGTSSSGLSVGGSVPVLQFPTGSTSYPTLGSVGQQTLGGQTTLPGSTLSPSGVFGSSNQPTFSTSNLVLPTGALLQ